MSQEAIFHLDESNVVEDLEYYTTDVRDKHDQIKPSENIVHLTPYSATHASFLTPITPYSLERLYLGVSMPLFSNAWGSSFLRCLLTLIKPQGDIILPVYPEAESAIKAYWCRSALEDVFRSRELWSGFSNVNAENDGVMSMRVGRKWPKPIPSTAHWLMNHAAKYAIAESSQDGGNTHKVFLNITDKAWRSGIASGVCERILQDRFGARHPIKICEVGGNGLLASELLCPDTRLNVQHACVLAEDDAPPTKKLLQYVSQSTAGRIPEVITHADERQWDALFVNITDTDTAATQRLQDYWQMLAPGGVLVWRGASDLSASALPQQQAYSMYYSHTAMPIVSGKTPTHYSATVAGYIQQQQQSKTSAFQIFQKS